MLFKMEKMYGLAKELDDTWRLVEIGGDGRRVHLCESTGEAFLELFGSEMKTWKSCWIKIDGEEQISITKSLNDPNMLKISEPIAVKQAMTLLCLNDEGKYKNETRDFGPFDEVSRPAHYAAGRKYEPRKVIHDWGLDFNLGNAVKYISRAGRKDDAVQDLEKAIQYIQFELEELREAAQNG